MNDAMQRQLDKHDIRRAFDQAAAHYDEVAVLQREVGERVLSRLDLIKLEPRTILDLGSGTGTGARALAKRYKKARIVNLDIAPAMLAYARDQVRGWFSKQRYVCADAEVLPLADHSVDMIFSNLTLQWCEDLAGAAREFRRVLKPGGLLMFSTLGPDTLKELRAAWRAVDDNVHVHDFADMHDVGDAMVHARLADPVMDMEYITMTYADVHRLMRDLKTLGAHNAGVQRSHGLTGKSRLKQMIAAYEQFRRDGELPATYEVVYGHAWAPTRQQFEPQTESGEAIISPANIGRARNG